MVMSRTLVTLRNSLRSLALLSLVLAVSMVWGASAHAALEHPLIEEESISQAGSSSVTLSARVNDFGATSTYRYEYGSTSAYGSATQAANLGAVNGLVGAPAQLGGLQPGTTYHFRIVVENGEGAFQGEDFTFSTLQLSMLGLPDDRGYELVSPTDNEDAQVYTPEGSASGVIGFGAGSVSSFLPVRAAADGHAVVYVGEPTSEGNGNQTQGNQYLATRGPDGWTSKDMQPAGFFSPRYWAFSEDLSGGVLESREPLVPGAPAYPDQDLYVRDEDGGLQALSTVTPPNRGPGEFGAVGGEQGFLFAGASHDSKHLFFEANDALTQNAVDGGEAENNLYESVDGNLRLVNVLPDGSAEPNASFGAPPENSEAENSEHAISSDGSRAFWTDVNTGALYVRVNGTSTVLIAEHATFWTASADGSRVLYAKGGDLYEDDLSTGATTDLAPGGEVQGIVGASEDASYVYFVADGTLASGAVAGESNLYLYHEGATTLIATLALEEEEEPGDDIYGFMRFGDWRPALGDRTAEATPDGHALTFMSIRSLTGYDNLNEEDRPFSEVYVYDAVSGKLSCASCNPSGERPRGSLRNFAGYVPNLAGYLSVSREESTSQLRLISEDGGRVLFQSTVPLVAQDVNGKDDVYEWESDGTGSCHLNAGCIYLLSDGSSSAPSFLLDGSADGSNVFIVTSAQLVPRDENEIYDVYDVRIGVEAPPTSPQCTGSGCQGVPGAPPIFATPSSVTFNGVGNFAAPTKAVAKKPKAKKKSKSKTRRKHGAKKQAHKTLKRRPGSSKKKGMKATVVTGTSGRGGR